MVRAVDAGDDVRPKNKSGEDGSGDLEEIPEEEEEAGKGRKQRTAAGVSGRRSGRGTDFPFR